MIVLALIIGGGPNQHLWTDHFLEIIMLPAMIIGFYNVGKWRLDGLTILLVFVIILLCIVQFLPFSLNSPLPATESLVPPPSYWTMSAYGSMESVLFVFPILGFFVFVSCFGEYEQQLLIRFIFLGFAINLISGAIELSYGANVQIEGVLPYVIRSGLFANENHFSTLVFMMIPLIAWRFMWYAKRPLAYITLALLIVVFLFAVGSRAGMGISAALAIFCLFWKATESDGRILRIGAIFVLIALAAFSFSYLESASALEGDLRLTFYKNTMKAISDYWFTGTGLGTFIYVYPMFEPREDLVQVYANHAHNDWLELILEIGFIFFIPLVALFLIQLFRHAMRTPLTQAATLSVLAVLLHSVVDYPLRTMAIATTFAVLLAIILSKGELMISPVEEPEITPRHRRRENAFEEPPSELRQKRRRPSSDKTRSLADELLPQSHRSKQSRSHSHRKTQDPGRRRPPTQDD